MSVPFEKSAASWAKSRLSKQTRDAYLRDLKLWVTFCHERGENPGSPSDDAPNEFRDLLEKDYSPLSVRRTLACLSAAFVAVRPGSINHFAKKRLGRPPDSNMSRTEAVSDEDARGAIAAAAERGRTPLRDTALLWVLWATGMRRISAASIRRDGMRRRRGVTIVRHLIKGGEEVETELSDEAAQKVATWLKVAPPSGWLFCTRQGRALSPQAITAIVAAASAAASIHIHPHQFRSAVITQALDAKIPLERVARFVHHKDIRSTLRYDRGHRGAGVAAEIAAFRARRG